MAEVVKDCLDCNGKPQSRKRRQQKRFFRGFSGSLAIGGAIGFAPFDSVNSSGGGDES